MTTRAKATYALWVLFAINMLNFFDRNIAGPVTEPLRKEFNLTDTEIGLLGTVFTLLYAVVGVPLGRMTDRTVRTRLLTAGVFVWSLFTTVSGFARNYSQLLLGRLGVGVGEATCAPAATSLIGDLFPASKRARALSVFMLGLPVGIALSNAIIGWVTQKYGWRDAYFIAGVPGLLCVVAAWFITEPARGASEVHDIGGLKREGSPYKLVLSIPTMWWVILSGALHNFNMYALGQFLIAYLQRFHGIGGRDAGLVSMVTYGLCGAPGLIIGGFLGDHFMKRRSNGRLLVGAVALTISVPMVFLSLLVDKGHIATFMVFMGLGCASMYVYYSTVYSTIHDIIEPSLRGTAMALYFCAMYVLGASLGPLGTGFASDYFTHKAALAAGVTAVTKEALEPYKATGLHQAMFLLPALGALLAVVLFLASRTVGKDMEHLNKWMKEASGRPAVPAGVVKEVAG